MARRSEERQSGARPQSQLRTWHRVVRLTPSHDGSSVVAVFRSGRTFAVLVLEAVLEASVEDPRAAKEDGPTADYWPQPAGTLSPQHWMVPEEDSPQVNW